MVQANKLPLLFCTDDLYHTEGLDDATQKILSIQTYYESMWIERGLNIKYIKYQLPHEGLLQEPDVEIPLDDYRSYHRPKRSYNLSNDSKYFLLDNIHKVEDVANCIKLQKKDIIVVNDSPLLNDFDKAKVEINDAFEKILPNKSSFEL